MKGTEDRETTEILNGSGTPPLLVFKDCVCVSESICASHSAVMVWQSRCGSWLDWTWVGPGSTAKGQMWWECECVESTYCTEVCEWEHAGNSGIIPYESGMCCGGLVTGRVCVRDVFYQGLEGGRLLWQSFLLEEIGLNGRCRGPVRPGKPPATIISDAFQTKVEENCWYSTLVQCIPHLERLFTILAV